MWDRLPFHSSPFTTCCDIIISLDLRVHFKCWDWAVWDRLHFRSSPFTTCFDVTSSCDSLVQHKCWDWAVAGRFVAASAGLCGTAYLFILHHSPVVMSSAHLTCWCSASVGTGLWPAALSLRQLGCVGLASRTASLHLFPPGARHFGSVLGKVRCVCDWLPFVSSSDEGVCASASDATPVL